MSKEHKEECEKLKERRYEPNDESLLAIRETDAMLTFGSYTTYPDAKSLLVAAYADYLSSG